MGRYAELQKAWDENREEFRRLKEEMEKNEDAFLKIDQEKEAMEQEPIKDSDVVAGKHRTQFQKRVCALNVRLSAVKSWGRIARYASASQRLKEAENIMMCAKHYVIWRKTLYL